jgi:hypothetical protein
MADAALPLIDEGDYPAFQRLIPELQTMSYDRWHDEHRFEVAYRLTQGDPIKTTPVSPEEFAVWLKGKGKTAAHLGWLLRYTDDRWSCLS